MSNLFIALGGTGYKVVSEVQKSNRLFYSSRGGFDSNSYLYIDTDQISIEGVSANDPHTKIINLGSFKPADHYKGEKKVEINKWLDGEGITMPDKTLREGAQAIRQLSRMAFYYDPNYRDIIEGLLKDFKTNNQEALDRNENNLAALKIYIVTGSAGGTGSGIFIDLVYTMWRYYIDGGDNGNMDIRAIILMPNLFLGVNDQDLRSTYMLNGYAFFQELNALVRQGRSTEVNDQFCNFLTGHLEGIPDSTWQPIKAGILIDDTNKLFDFTHNNLYYVISEFLLAYTLGRDIHGDQKILNEDINSITVEAALQSAIVNSSPDKNDEYINFFSSFGILVLKSANDHFADFVKNQLNQDILHSILGDAPLASNSQLNNTELNFNPDYKEILYKINDEFNILNAEKLNTLVIPGKLSKSEKELLNNLVVKIDFLNEIPLINNSNLQTFVDQIVEIRKALFDKCESVRNYINEFHESWLGNGNSLGKILDIFKGIDQHYYDAYLTESKVSSVSDKVIDIHEVVRSKARKYFYYILSKGHEKTNDQGYLDYIYNHLSSLEKETKSLLKTTQSKHQNLILTLNSYIGNGATKLVPDVKDIISTRNKISVINPDGFFSQWYNLLSFDLNRIQGDIMKNIFSNNELSFKNTFVISKFSKALKEEIDEKIKQEIEANNEFQSRMAKSLLQIIQEINYDTSFNYMKNFNYPYIKLTEPELISKFAYAGHFQGHMDMAENLGYRQNNINDILIDDPFYKDRIIKIAFHHKISFNKYFNFVKLKETFAKLYTIPKQNRLKIPCPFLHKDFAGPNFDGNVFGVLNSIGQQSIKSTFMAYPEDLKQLIYKFGLVYLAKYVQKGLETPDFFKSLFNSQCITYNETSHEIVLANVNYRSALNLY